MADNVDQAAERTELILSVGLAYRKPEPPVASGRCLNCGELLPESGSRWCDADCKFDWEKRQARR